MRCMTIVFYLVSVSVFYNEMMTLGYFFLYFGQIDAVAKSRDGRFRIVSNDEREQTLNQLLTVRWLRKLFVS